MDDIRFYEELVEKVLQKERQKTSYAEKFLADEGVLGLIKKYANSGMTEDEIVHVLNKLLTTDEVKEKFQIPKERRVIVTQGQVRRVINEIRKRKNKRDANKEVGKDSNKNTNENTNKNEVKQGITIQGAGKAKPLIDDEPLFS